MPRALLRLLALLTVGLGWAAAAGAQAPLTLVDDETTVGSLGFAFQDAQTLTEEALRLEIALKEPPGFFGRILGGGGGGGVYPFDPILLGRDVVRLQRFYVESGFPRADVDYEVALDTTDNTVDVTFLITEGPPLLIERVTYAGPGQADVLPLLAPDVRDEWRDFTDDVSLPSGRRLDQVGLLQLQAQTVSWLRDRGYAYADAGAEAFPDTTGLRADVRVKVNVGPRAVFGDVTILSTDSTRGAPGISDGVILRELPFEPGDRFDASALAEGQREVFGLGVFQLAVVNEAPGQAYGDETVDVVVRVRRGPPRVATAFLGYFSDGGLTGRAGFTHRNAFGGARTLGADVEARTGIGGFDNQSVSGGPIRDYRATLTFRQPYVLDRRLSYTLQPSVRQRDDEIESSRQAEVANTFLFTRRPLQTVALSLTGRYRDLSRGQGFRFVDGGLFRTPPVPTLQSQTLTAATGVLGVDATWGRTDDPLQPTRGLVLRPSAAAAGGDVSFARGRLSATALAPFGERIGLVARLTGGAVSGLGGTDADAVGDYVLLRDQLFYAGGTGDVRGWGGAQLGPKTLVITPATARDTLFDPTAVTGRGDVSYVGIGGRAKVSASVQANLPFPVGPPQLGAIVFLDGGRVWSPSRVPTDDLLRASGTPADLTLAELIEEDDAFRFGAGAGLQYLTPVGFISVALGYKLNPSYLDLRDAARVYCGDSIYEDEPVCAGPDETFGPDNAPGYLDARLRGVDFDPGDIEIRSVTGGLLGFLNPLLRRSQFHISIGQTF